MNAIYLMSIVYNYVPSQRNRLKLKIQKYVYKYSPIFMDCIAYMSSQQQNINIIMYYLKNHMSLLQEINY